MKKFMINTTSGERCTGGSEREQKVTRHASLWQTNEQQIKTKNLNRDE
jgi:hypothetical protein